MKAQGRYATFLSPLQVGSFTLRNRAVMGSMHTGMEDKEADFHDLGLFLGERASRDGAGLIITGGISPSVWGWVSPFSARLTSRAQAEKHKILTKAVHEHKGLVAMQILHAGRYGYHPLIVAPSRIKSPITPFTPRALTGWGVERTIRDFVRCATLAQEAGYDGVEVMASEGYLLCEFLSARTNKRIDAWGGSWEKRMRLPVQVVEQIRAAVGPDFLIVFRLSLLDLVDGGCTWEEVLELAAAVERAGASIINSGIGWHEARVPTIATSVPRAAFVWTTAKLKASGRVSIPVIATNRINTPEVAEEILASGKADLVSMARPFLADPFFVDNARQGKAINICIACNQACLDHTFTKRRASCLVNPRAGR
jgi:2,4-dienoyl-CoA reductase (NADPH2)